MAFRQNLQRACTPRTILPILGVRRSHNVATSSVAPSARLTSILVANRGEIALRVARTAAQNGVRTTTIYTDVDANAEHVTASPFSVHIGDSTAYLDGDRIIKIAKEHGCGAIHPGYGFLSENSAFAQKCSDAGLTFIGPPSAAIEAMGNKSRSKEIMIAAGVPCIPGYHGANQDPELLKAEAEKIRYPVLLKAVKGGGGKGMRIVQTPDQFMDQLNSAKSEATNSFGDDTMLVEKYITTPRHIEVQVFADKFGNSVALGERDCSIQRRHQKILEESPAPDLAENIRQDLWAKARAAALAVKYEGAGTVEFIFDNDTGEFFFMEMNTRLQVEHPVTEMVTGEDLVRWQLIVAEGGKLPLTQEEVQAQMATRGHAIEARIYAENPDMNFIPDSGRILHMQTPKPSADVRIDAGFRSGDEVSSYYDPMIAKLIVRAEDRPTALQKLAAALEEYEIAGLSTNVEFLKTICRHPDFVAGDVETGFIPKRTEELFAKKKIHTDVYAQAAIGIVVSENANQRSINQSGVNGFTGNNLTRQIKFRGVEQGAPEVVVDVSQLADGTFGIRLGDQILTNIKSSWDSTSKILTSLLPTQRVESRLIQDGEKIMLFQHGSQFILHQVTPNWLEKALGIKDTTHSVLAPMPCKILRVEVEEGAHVEKDQPLVVIESMKMETVIRSPQDGIVAKVVHKKGDLCKAGTALVEFQE